jgi:hypothetical protein
MARGKIQIHLSTAFTLMLMASGIVYLNVQNWLGNWQDHESFGWPWESSSRWRPENSLDFHHYGIAADLFVAVLLLITVWALCETIISFRKSTNNTIIERGVFKIHILTISSLTNTITALLLVNCNLFDRDFQIYHEDYIGWPFKIWPRWEGTLNIDCLIIDIIVFICIAGAVPLLCEFIIRRLENRARPPGVYT